MNPPIKGSGASSIKIEILIEIEGRGRSSYIDGRRARDQNAGGGRMNCAVAGRKVSETQQQKSPTGSEQNRRRRDRRGADSGVSGGADRASMARRSGVLVIVIVRVGGLGHAHHTHQRDREYRHSSHEYTPICRIPRHVVNDSTLRWSSVETGRRKNELSVTGDLARAIACRTADLREPG